MTAWSSMPKIWFHSKNVRNFRYGVSQERTSAAFLSRCPLAPPTPFSLFVLILLDRKFLRTKSLLDFVRTTRVETIFPLRTSQCVKWTSGPWVMINSLAFCNPHFDRSVARSLDTSLDRSIAPALARSVDRPIARWLDSSTTRSLAHSSARSRDR